MMTPLFDFWLLLAIALGFIFGLAVGLFAGYFVGFRAGRDVESSYDRGA